MRATHPVDGAVLVGQRFAGEYQVLFVQKVDRFALRLGRPQPAGLSVRAQLPTLGSSEEVELRIRADHDPAAAWRDSGPSHPAAERTLGSDRKRVDENGCGAVVVEGASWNQVS